MWHDGDIKNTRIANIELIHCNFTVCFTSVSPLKAALADTKLYEANQINHFKVGCICPIVSILSHVESGRNDHGDDASHFIWLLSDGLSKMTKIQPWIPGLTDKNR